MNLYLISQMVNNDWDTFDSAVVAAETEKEAQGIHPDGQTGDEYHTPSCWVSPDCVSVKLIGIADPTVERGVICASFNAG